jgi:hypothetical protein
MAIALPQLGDDFKVQAVNSGNNYNTTAVNGAFEITPGTYLLQPGSASEHISPSQKYRNITIGEFVAPAANLTETVVKNMTPKTMSADRAAQICFEVISPQKPGKVEVILFANGRPVLLEAQYKGADIYVAALTESQAAHGVANYNIVLSFENGQKTFPAGKPGRPGNWDYYDETTYTVQFIPDHYPLVIWDAGKDHDNTICEWIPGRSLKPQGFNELTWNISMDSLPRYNHYNTTVNDYTFKYFFKNDVKGRQESMSQKSRLVVGVSTGTKEPQPIEIGIITAEGIAFTATFEVVAGTNIYTIPLSGFKQGKYVMVKRPYPGFMPYFHESDRQFDLDSGEMETIQFSVKKGLSPKVDLSVAKIWLE